ncbi:MAG TPA: hypothetical protein VE863_06055 [Pyrinomonadaceae bacterium]|jgi:hypothetical protein|nr:hypothetical protein [Pyrinomonadaceae bacterium]
MHIRTLLFFTGKFKIPTIAVLGALLFLAGCSLIHRRVETEKLLTPLANADTPDLIAAVNKLVTVQSIHGRVDIQFEDTSFATAGIAEKYRSVDGSITLQRPGKIYLTIQAPVVATDIVQMTSDGEHFRIAILKGDEKYRKFVKGTNSAVYSKLDIDGTGNARDKTSETQAVNALSNLRPQHITDALMLNPINPQAAGTFYVQSEFFESEKDTSKSDSSKRLVRGYYFLDELIAGGEKGARLSRRFWFDRVGGIRLARMQSFDENGVLANDVSYGPLTKFGAEGDVMLPGKISLTRPHDQYKISITYQTPESLTINREYDPGAFILINKANLPEVDLDEKKPNPPKN